MKRCPYCAEEIQDQALKCRWCGSDLTLPPDKVVAHPPPETAAVSEEAAEPAPSQATVTPPPEPAWEPTAPQPSIPPPSIPPPSSVAAQPPEILSPARTPSPDPSLTFSHEGPRFLLGYSAQYYGIWDKQAPGPPIKRFPRTDPGWQQAWEAFIREEMSAG